MTPKTTEIAARKVYNQTFEKLRDPLGAPGAKPPPVVFVPAGQGYTTSGPDNWGEPVKVQIGPGAARQLASDKPKIRNAARFAILHEFGRVYGPTSAYQDAAGNTGAGKANEFANQASRYLNGKLPAKKFKAWAKKRMDQWGKHPKEITVPAP